MSFTFDPRTGELLTGPPMDGGYPDVPGPASAVVAQGPVNSITALPKGIRSIRGVGAPPLWPSPGAPPAEVGLTGSRRPPHCIHGAACGHGWRTRSPRADRVAWNHRLRRVMGSTTPGDRRSTTAGGSCRATKEPIGACPRLRSEFALRPLFTAPASSCSSTGSRPSNSTSRPGARVVTSSGFRHSRTPCRRATPRLRTPARAEHRSTSRSAYRRDREPPHPTSVASIRLLGHAGRGTPRRMRARIGPPGNSPLTPRAERRAPLPRACASWTVRHTSPASASAQPSRHRPKPAAQPPPA